jgi:hypothetical protein
VSRQFDEWFESVCHLPDMERTFALNALHERNGYADPETHAEQRQAEKSDYQFFIMSHEDQVEVEITYVLRVSVPARAIRTINDYHGDFHQAPEVSQSVDPDALDAAVSSLSYEELRERLFEGFETYEIK